MSGCVQRELHPADVTSALHCVFTELHHVMNTNARAHITACFACALHMRHCYTEPKPKPMAYPTLASFIMSW
jgi:hypothetical protein